MDSQTITERIIDPESRVAISSETEQSSENASGSAPGVTVASNLPDGDVGADGDSSQRSANQSKERQNFEVSETRRERVIVPGAIRRVSVAVMVDGIRETGADGKEVWAPRPAEEMETLRQLVRSAIGFDEARGDTVTIESLQFSPVPEQGTLVENAGLGLPRGLGRPPRPARRPRRHRAGADLLRAPPDDRPPPGHRARRADRPARDRRRPPPRRRRRRSAATRSSSCRRRPSARSSGCATSSPAGARTAPRCSGAGSSPPTAARSPPDHERLSPGDVPARRRARLPAGRPGAPRSRRRARRPIPRATSKGRPRPPTASSRSRGG